jgi:hypothetical protein
MDSLKKVVVAVELKKKAKRESGWFLSTEDAVLESCYSWTYGAQPLGLLTLCGFIGSAISGCDRTPTDDEVIHWRKLAALGFFFYGNRYGNPRNMEVACITQR